MSDSNQSETGPKITRRDLIKKGALAVGVIAAAKVTTTLFENEQPEHPSTNSERNLEQAKRMLRQIGITDRFSTSSSEAMYNANLEFSKDSRLATTQLGKFYDMKGEILGLEISRSGEATPLRSGPDNRPQVIEGIAPALTDTQIPRIIFDIKSGPSGARYTVVGYSDVANLQQLLEQNPEAIKQLLLEIFTHSTSPLNILHLPRKGIPDKVFNHPDFPDTAYTMTGADIPPSISKGGSAIRHNKDTGQPTRIDIHISATHVKKEAELTNMPPHAVLAGIFANEAYGVAIDTHRVKRRLPEVSGRREVGSTAADWATKFQVAHNQPNAFFSVQSVELMKKLASL